MFSSIISAIISLAACAFAAPTVPAATNPISFAGNPAEYMKGFKNPRIDTSAGGKANCISGTVDVKASANNVHIQLQEPATQAVLTEFLIEAVEINSTLIERITGGPTHVCGTFGIYSQLCFPLGKINATTIQFLTPGAGADQSYWNIAPEYSYVDYAAEQGYITFLYDRLASSRHRARASSATSTFAGRKFHAPLWKPYALYQTVDLVYAPIACEQYNGWPGAHAAMNVVETTGYVAFFWMAATYGVFDGKRGKSRLFTMVWAGRKVEGTRGATMVLGLFGLSLVTVVKTIIYGLIEYFSGWRQVGHNTAADLFFFWIVPNGLWLIFPNIMLYSSARDIVRGLSTAAHASSALKEVLS